VNAHPSHYFIKYLLVSQDDISAGSVNSTLALHGMVNISAEYLQVIQAELGNQPEEFRPWDRTHKETSKWLRSQKIFSFIHPDHSTIAMRDKILGDPRLRRTIETLLLGNVGCREASYRLSKLDHSLSDVALAEYQHYFWNLKIMGLDDWAAYFSLDASEEGTGRTSYNQNAYTAALHSGPEVALYRAGVRRELDSKKIILEVQSELYHTFKEVSALPLSKAKVEMLSFLGRGLARIDERIQAGDQALQDVLKRFEKFRVLTDGGKVPALIELAPTGSISEKSRAEILSSREQ
jgi:hypothetical protein